LMFLDIPRSPAAFLSPPFLNTLFSIGSVSLMSQFAFWICCFLAGLTDLSCS
jgi:hypothetical protein